MEICIHRGSRQIGGSCVELKSGGRSLIIDMGLPLDAEDDGISHLPGLFLRKDAPDRILAVIISHSHLDHCGLVQHLPEGIPVIMGEFSRKIILAASPFIRGGLQALPQGPALQHGKRFSIGPFSITPYLVDHSGYDAYALLVEADGKRVFYSGDFRMHGRKSHITGHLMKNPPRDIDLLLMEGTSLGRSVPDQPVRTETDIENEFYSIFSEAKGLPLVHASAQNIDRIVSLYRACLRSGRTLVLDLYSAVILEAAGSGSIPQSDWQNIALYIPQAQRVQIKRNGWFDILDRHSLRRIFPEQLEEHASRYVLLFRPAHIRDLELCGLAESAVYIYSQWKGYRDNDSYKPVAQFIGQNSITEYDVHTSGHADMKTLVRFAAALGAKSVSPIHTFEPERFSELFSNAVVINDGEYRTI